MQLAITGATGHIGGQVARLLSDQGLPLILPLRNPSRAPRLPDCEPRPFSYGDFELARDALQGVDALFMVSAAESPTREQEHLTLVRAAQAAGIQHLVYLSFAEARPDSTFTLARTHAVTEEAIRRSTMKHTFVRDNFYSELMARLADAEGVICGPAEQGRVACVAQRDAAQAVANIMADIAAGGTQHQGRTYTLTGSQSLSMEDIARILTTCTGKPHRFHNETIAEAFASRRAAYPETPRANWPRSRRTCPGSSAGRPSPSSRWSGNWPTRAPRQCPGRPPDCVRPLSCHRHRSPRALHRFFRA